jgi:4-hydroxy-tetrahydrodipicolinate synthase
MSYERFVGTGVAVVTPFTSDNVVDYKNLERIINHLIYGGIEYLVIMGTTGESATLSTDEKNKIFESAKETIDGRVPLVAGIGGNNTAEIIHSIQDFDFTSVDAILSVSPYYNKPTQQGIYYHYKAISEASPIPIILYNVPGRTSSNISSETTLKLATDFKNIIGIKEASCDIEQVMQIIENKPDGFLVISGDDNLTLPLLSLGTNGVISVIGNAYPRQMSEMVRAGLKGNFEEARKLHFQLHTLMNLIFSEGNPAGIKILLEKLGLCSSNVRLPLFTVSKELKEKLLGASLQ